MLGRYFGTLDNNISICGIRLHSGASDVLALDVSKNMVEGAKTETDKFLQTNDQ